MASKRKAREPPGLQLRSEFKDLRTQRANGISSNPSLNPKIGEDLSQLKDNQSEFSLTQPFFSIQAFNRLDEPHLLWRGQSALHCLRI